MCLSSHACRRTFQKGGRAQSGHLWIGDDFVARTFARFVGCSQRRHGSSVPGPLEARRRLNRRRNMNFARAGAGAGVEAALLFGAGNLGHVHWRPPNSPEEPTGRISFPAYPPLPPSPPPESQANDDPTLSSRSQETSTVDDTRKTIGDFDTSRGGWFAVSPTPFEHLLNTYRDAHDIHQFLLDPSLNTPQARNFTTLMEHLVKHEVQLNEIEAHVRLLEELVASASICADELGILVRLIPDIKIGNSTIEKKYPFHLGSFIKHLWKKTTVCIKSRPEYARNMDFNAWLDVILFGSPTSFTLAVAMDILSCYQKDSPVRYYAQYFLHLLRLGVHRGHAQGKATSSRVRCYNREAGLYLKDINFLRKSLADESFLLCVSDVTEVLVTTPESEPGDTENAECLLLWTWILHRINSASALLSRTETFRDLERRDMMEITTSDLCLEQKCGLRLWLVTVLGLRTAWFQESQEYRRQIRISLLDYLSHTASQGGDPISPLVDILDDLKERGLPNTQPVIMAAARLEYQQMGDSASDLSARLDEMVGLVNKTGIPTAKLLVRGYGRSVQYAPNKWFFQFAQSVDITSTQFRNELLQNMGFRCPRRAILRTILSYHLGGKIALALANNTLRKDTDGSIIPSERFPRSNYSDAGSWTDSDRFVPDPTECLRTFHILVVTCAFSPDLRTEVAWRQCYWCFKFLRRHHAPMTPLIVRSLYYAGIARYHENGKKIPLEKILFLVRLTRRVEGSAAADKIVAQMM